MEGERGGLMGRAEPGRLGEEERELNHVSGDGMG
jgi:hypothetical protein